LGNPNLDQARSLAVMARRLGADRFAAKAIPVIREIQQAGIATQRGIAVALTARGVDTRRGGPWNARQVKSVLDRAARLSQTET